MFGLAHRGFSWNDYRPHLASVLSNAGYHTVLCGVQHEAPRKRMTGFQTFLDGDEEYFNHPELIAETWDRQNADLVAEYIRERRAGGDDAPGAASGRPFFLSWGCLNAHRPYPGAGSAPVADGAPRPAQRDFAAFRTALGQLDDSLGSVLDAIDETDSWRDTIVIFTTDHGAAFPGMKATLTDAGTGVSLYVHFPDVRGGSGVDAIVSHLDLVPTILGLVGLPVPDDLEGCSLLPTMGEETAAIHRYVFSETTFHAAYEPARSVRTQRYRYTIRPVEAAATRHALPVNVDDSVTKDEFANRGFFTKPLAPVELIDYELDPEGTVNRAGTAAYREIERELHEVLHDWMKRTDDPLRNGPVAPPPGAVVDAVTAWSPS